MSSKSSSSFGESTQDKVIIVLGLALVVGAFFLGNFYGQLSTLRSGGNSLAGSPIAPGQDDQFAPEAPQGPLTDEQWQAVLSDPAAVKGDANAPVTIVEFTDYQCPFCKRHFDETAGLIDSNYIDSGQVRLLVRDLPLPFHDVAPLAAQAARCAGDQDRYWDMYELLFDNQQVWSSGDATSEFKSYAGQIGLNQGTFDSCLDSGQYADAVDADLALASQVGASGTPTFFINGNILVGAQPFSAFEAAIEAEL